MCKVDKYNMERRVDVGLLGCWSVADAAREKPGGITMRLVWRKGCGDKKEAAGTIVPTASVSWIFLICSYLMRSTRPTFSVLRDEIPLRRQIDDTETWCLAAILPSVSPLRIL